MIGLRPTQLPGPRVPFIVVMERPSPLDKMINNHTSNEITKDWGNTQPRPCVLQCDVIGFYSVREMESLHTGIRARKMRENVFGQIVCEYLPRVYCLLLSIVCYVALRLRTPFLGQKLEQNVLNMKKRSWRSFFGPVL